MTIDPITLQEDAAEQQAHQQKISLEDLVSLGEELEQLTSEREALEALAKQVGEKINELSTRAIPDALSQLGLKMFKLADGTVVEQGEVVTAGIGEANREEAHAWLRQHGHGDLIKNEVKVTFGKGEDEQAKKLWGVIADLHERGDLRYGALEQKETVHYQTLNAFVRERLRSGETLPLETFKVFIGQVAKLRRPKEKIL